MEDQAIEQQIQSFPRELPPDQQLAALVNEQAELNDRHSKLTEFIKTDIFDTFSRIEKAHARVQAKTMELYSKTLASRIATFPWGQSTDSIEPERIDDPGPPGMRLMFKIQIDKGDRS